jgi:hypothetical protein
MERQNMTHHTQALPGAPVPMVNERISVARYFVGLIISLIAGLIAYWIAPKQVSLAVNILIWSTVVFYLIRLTMALRNHLAMSRLKSQIIQEQLMQQRLITEQQEFDNRKVIAEVRKIEAEARKTERESNTIITVAKAGEQVYITEVQHDTTTRPLHLAPGMVNGRSWYDEEELRRWAAYNYLYSHSGSGQRAPATPDLPTLTAGAPGFELPSMIHWHDLVPGQRGDLNNLVLGVKLNQAGRLEPLTVSLHNLFHTIAAASTGYGKSGFINALLAQLATSPDPVEFVLIDQQDHGLVAFRQCDRLRYPLLREPGEILSALREVHQEATLHRSALLARYDADSLAEYNQRTGDFIAPIVIVIDEAATLLDSSREIKTELKRHAWELRKFGVYQFLMLTSAKGTTIDTDHRQQFSSKIQLHANEKAQARLLMDAPEALSFPPGRAMISLPGLPLTVVQTPYIDKQQVRALLRPASTPPAPPPELEPEPDTPTDKQQQTLDLWDAGERREYIIAGQVYSDGGGRQCELVRKTLEKFGRI